MKYRIMISIGVDARDGREALEYAKKLDSQLNSPMAKMMVEAEGIRLFGDGHVVVHQPLLDTGSSA